MDPRTLYTLYIHYIYTTRKGRALTGATFPAPAEGWWPTAALGPTGPNQFFFYFFFFSASLFQCVTFFSFFFFFFFAKVAEGHQPSAGAGKVAPVRARPFLVEYIPCSSSDQTSHTRNVFPPSSYLTE